LRANARTLGKELLGTFAVAPKIVCTEEGVEFGEAPGLPMRAEARTVKDRRGARSSVDVDQ